VLRLVLFLIFLSYSAWGQSQQPPQIPTHQQAPNSDSSQTPAAGKTQNAGPSSPGIPIVPPSNLEKESSSNGAQGADKGSEFWPILGHRLKITDSLLAAFTFLLVLIGGWQGIQLKRTVDVTKIAARAAQDAAEALPKIERAYVFAKVKLEMGLLMTPSGTAKSSMMVHFPNRGKTPAMLTKIRAYAVIQKETPIALRPPQDDEREYPEGMVIKADGMLDQPVTIGISQTEFGEMERKEKTLFCLGRIEYDDVLGDHRETGFCWHFVPRLGGTGTFEITPKTKLNYYK